MPKTTTASFRGRRWVAVLAGLLIAACGSDSEDSDGDGGGGGTDASVDESRGGSTGERVVVCDLDVSRCLCGLEAEGAASVTEVPECTAEQIDDESRCCAQSTWPDAGLCGCFAVGCFDDGTQCLCNTASLDPIGTPVDSCTAAAGGTCCTQQGTPDSVVGGNCYCLADPGTECPAGWVDTTQCSTDTIECAGNFESVETCP